MSGKEEEAAVQDETLGEELNRTSDGSGKDEPGKKKKKKKVKKGPKAPKAPKGQKGQKGKPKKLLLLLIPLAVLVVAAGVLAVLKLRGGPAEEPPSPSSASSSAEARELFGPPVPEPEAPEEEKPVLTVTESVDYIRNLSPASLGLEGDSMDDYKVYASPGTILVDGVPCTEISVYQVDPETGTNTYMGRYLLDRSGAALYRLDPEQGAVVEVPGE